MIRYIGLDVHKEVVQASIIDEQGQRLESHRLPCTKESLEAFARERLLLTDHVALEATTNTWAVVALLRPHVEKIVVGNPLRTRAIAEAKVKTDKVDAEVLAQLLRCDYLPAVWQPDEETQRLRELSAHRASLVADEVRLKNRVRSLLAQRLIVPPTPSLFGLAGRKWLRETTLLATDRLIIDGFLRLLDQLEAEEARVEKTLAELSYPKEEVRLLMTLPGVGCRRRAGARGRLGRLAALSGRRCGGELPGTDAFRAPVRPTRATTDAYYQGGQPAGALATHAGRPAGGAASGALGRDLPAAQGQEEPQRGGRRHGAQARGHRAPDAQEQRTVSLRPAGYHARQAREVADGSHGRAAKKVRSLGRTEAAPAAGSAGEEIRALNEVYGSEALPTAKALPELAAGERKALEVMGVIEHVERVQTRQVRFERKSLPKTV